MTIPILGKKIIHDFALIYWSSLDDTNHSVNEHFNDFYKKTNECISLHVPKKKVTKNGLKLRSKPWVNTRIQNLMHYRDKLFASMNRNSIPSNRYLYKKFRNRVVAEQRKSKIDYFQKYFETNKTNMKMLW